MSKHKNDDNSWIAPLAHAILSAPKIEDSVGPMTCPICDCDHQIFQGMGAFCPDKKGTSLVCAFPSTETMVKIDMPPDIQVKGTVTYVRYTCGCNGHRWAILTAFLADSTVVWCVDLTPHTPPKSCKKGKGKSKPEAPTLANSIKTMLQGIKAAGHQPVVVLGPGIAQQLPPEALQELQAQGAKFGPPTPTGPKQPLPPPQLGRDHEHPLSRLPSTVRYAWQNWRDKKPLKDSEVLNYSMPKLPSEIKPEGQPPHMAVGTNDSKLFEAMKEWIFGLAVETDTTALRMVGAFVYWDNLLIVVMDETKAEKRKEAAKNIADAIISMNRLKPDMYLMSRSDYELLVVDRKNKVPKKKTK